jgi:FtsH-binding integral membrane protein
MDCSAKFASFQGLVSCAISFVQPLIPIVFALCVLAFFWGTAKYIRTASDNPDDLNEAKNFLIYGLIGLFVAVSLWGLIGLMQGFLGANTNGQGITPTPLTIPS